MTFLIIRVEREREGEAGREEDTKMPGLGLVLDPFVRTIHETLLGRTFEPVSSCSFARPWIFGTSQFGFVSFFIYFLPPLLPLPLPLILSPRSHFSLNPSPRSTLDPRPSRGEAIFSGTRARALAFFFFFFIDHVRGLSNAPK